MAEKKKESIVLVTASQNQSRYITYGQMNLISDFRALWTEVAIWIRSFMVSMITGFGDLKAISNRLYRIPSDFKGKLQPFLGVELAGQFEQLLLMYIINAQTFIAALYNKDPVTVDAAVVNLRTNADELADFLAGITSYWSKSQWQNLLYQLNELIISEVIALISGEYEKELNIRDRMLKHALILGDYTANGVIQYLVPTIPPVETERLRLCKRQSQEKGAF